METFTKALDFLQENETNNTALITFIEQLLCEASDEVIETALENTKEFINLLNKHK
jgi:hypothetical protein